MTSRKSKYTKSQQEFVSLTNIEGFNIYIKLEIFKFKGINIALGLAAFCPVLDMTRNYLKLQNVRKSQRLEGHFY